MNFSRLGKMIRSATPSPTRCLLLILLLVFAGCGKEQEAETILSHQPGFQIAIPEGFKLDETLNANDTTTSTWFREDGLALLAIDRQPLSGKRLKTLQKIGNKRYLAAVARELERDLGGRLEHFSSFHKEPMKLGKRDATLITFLTRHEGTNYKSYILVTLQLGDSAFEVMLDFRVPLDEAPESHTWDEVLSSWSWGEAKEKKEEASSDGGH